MWSAGIIWFQLLYGERPFGEARSRHMSYPRVVSTAHIAMQCCQGMGQEQMWSQKTIHRWLACLLATHTRKTLDSGAGRGTTVEFPEKIKVSTEVCALLTAGLCCFE